MAHEIYNSAKCTGRAERNVIHTIVLNDLVVCCLHIMDIVLVAGWLGRFDGSIYKLVVFDSVLDPI